MFVFNPLFTSLPLFPSSPLKFYLANSGFLCFQILVVNGKSGQPVWSYELPYHMRKSDALSVLTSDKKSVFLFWANEKQSLFKSLVSAEFLSLEEAFALKPHYLIIVENKLQLYKGMKNILPILSSFSDFMCFWALKQYFLGKIYFCEYLPGPFFYLNTYTSVISLNQRILPWKLWAIIYHAV